MSNTLIQLPMILAKAMRMVGDATPEASEPFEITAELSFSIMALTMQLDQFADEVLRPALDDAMATRQPVDAEAQFAAPLYGLSAYGSDLTASGEWKERGIVGRIRRWYDISRDVMPTRIDIRVCGAPDAAS